MFDGGEIKAQQYAGCDEDENDDGANIMVHKSTIQRNGTLLSIIVVVVVDIEWILLTVVTEWILLNDGSLLSL